MVSLNQLLRSVTTDVWRIRRKDLPPRKSFWLRQLRIVVLSVRDFNRDKCALHASALTFYTLLSVVPILALAFGIAKGFGLAELLEKTLRENVEGQEEAVNRLIEFSHNLLANAKGGVVAGIGVAFLIWTVVKVLGSIEGSFNEIWGIKESRSWCRKFSDYLTFMMIGPLVLIMASSMTVLVTSKIESFVQEMRLWGWVGSAVFLALKIIPLGLLWGLFTFTYMFMPNTKVNFWSGLMGGIVAGTLYQIVQRIYITFQIGVAGYGAIYGSFAALPLFLVWMQISWLIVLLGAEISFAHQHVDTYEFEPDCERVSPAFKRLVTLAVTQRCVKLFDRGQAPLSADEIAQHLEAPIRLINQVLHELVEARVLSEVRRKEDRVPAYQPARNVEEMTVGSVLEQLDEHGVNDIPISRTPEWQTMSESLKAYQRLMAKSEANVRLKDL